MATLNAKPSSYILLKGGTLLIHGQNNRVVPRVADLLIQDDRIHSIEDHIDPPEGAKIIDCQGAIVSPGFIDSHRHLWQSQQKGLHADHGLAQYYASGNLASSHYAPDDIFWGVLGSAMESVDSGTTTVVDHAHANYSSKHSNEAVRATISSGIRSIFCYCVHPRIISWQPHINFDEDMFPSWIMETFRGLAASQPFGPNGRVKLGFALDAMFVTDEDLRETLGEVRRLGAHLITCHDTRPGKSPAIPSAVSILHKNGLLGSDVLLSHANNITKEERAHAEGSGTKFSSTPLSELQMGHGDPVCLLPNFFSMSSIGSDSNSICTSYMPSHMAAALLDARSRKAREHSIPGMPPSIGPKVEDAYNLGTIFGAQAIGLGNEIGSLAVGKKADIVVIDGRSPAMTSVAHRNPVAAVVLHSSVREIQTVIIDGIIRKENFSLKAVDVPRSITHDADTSTGDSETVEWHDVVSALDRSRQNLDKINKEKVDQELVRKELARSIIMAMPLRGPVWRRNLMLMVHRFATWFANWRAKPSGDQGVATQ
ncbi:hypothetical protein N7493_002907 [Penicillium malachiteum]|uniref:Amidohydrolase-related domain-containing protein n=1 Tax=Penicillium malachiteum TaxID=1324776 RepID=A0AAD6HT97_9EURO|nr:hypothetical protein N7493_002907 [Penicillium malachiteum]